MVDLGTITWDTFLTSIRQILEISDRLFDGWCLQGAVDIEGAAYLVKRTTHHNLETFRPRPISNSPTEELDDLELDDDLESVLKDKHCGEEPNTHTVLTREYHVVYSPSYSVPVLYFNSWNRDGNLLNLEETWESVHSSFKPRLEVDKWQTLTQAEHPILHRPFYQLHPCGTARLLGCFADVTGNPVVTWLSSVGPAVRLGVRTDPIMADYWKSQAKKFCDFCKCWIADNKPSVEFHEKGKRHKENVEKRLKEIGQKSRKEYKETLKVDDEMRKMEEAAMKAYLKDVEGDGGDYTSQLIRQELREKEERMKEEEKKEERIREERMRDEKRKERETPADEGEPAGSSGAKEDAESSVPWFEAVSEEGHTYYWHVETGEAVWEPPEGGFVSTAQQEDKTRADKEAEEKREKREEKILATKRAEEDKAREEEERARLAREKMRSKAAKKEKKKEVVPFEPVAMGPAPKPDPYGGWKTVERHEEKPVDLELPKQSYAEVFVPSIVDTAPKFRIREKTIGSVDCDGSGDFKKRKLNGGSRRNARQRLDDD